jgi:hypothetical protein
MRRFSYEGDHAEVTLYGVTFPQGKPVPVEDAFLLKKLEGNNHFKEHSVDAPAAAVAPEVAAAPAPTVATKRKYNRKAA